MGKVIWSPSALKDVDSIAEYIARDSVDQASLFIVRLLEATDRLQNYPLSGRVIPEINNQDCREIIYGFYRIMYRIIEDEIWVTSVVHGALNNHLSNRSSRPERLGSYKVFFSSRREAGRYLIIENWLLNIGSKKRSG